MVRPEPVKGKKQNQSASDNAPDAHYDAAWAILNPQA
jgi:hypothetical protein